MNIYTPCLPNLINTNYIFHLFSFIQTSIFISFLSIFFYSNLHFYFYFIYFLEFKPPFLFLFIYFLLFIPPFLFFLSIFFYSNLHFYFFFIYFLEFKPPLFTFINITIKAEELFFWKIHLKS